VTGHAHLEAARWAARAPHVPEGWFVRRSALHGVRHTQRVHIHAQRLTAHLGWSPADAALVLCAALWHDIGRESDGVEPDHGTKSVVRADELGLTGELAPGDAAVVRFAVVRHSVGDRGAEAHAAELARAGDATRRLPDPERALRVLWLLKDADALSVCVFCPASRRTRASCATPRPSTSCRSRPPCTPPCPDRQGAPAARRAAPPGPRPASNVHPRHPRTP